jgi:predicted RNA-binding Zn ribbon-like protein
MSKTTDVRDFELIAGHPSLDLVNTLDWRFRPNGAEELLESYDALLGFMEESDLLTPKQARQLQRATGGSAGRHALEQCLELREAIAQVFYAKLDGDSPLPASLKTLEHYFKAARSRQQLRWKKTGLQWKWAEIEDEPEIPLWLLSLSAAGLMLSDDARRVRACDNLECRWLFMDTSKNHTRRWCDMKICGNRMKARRFKAQHKA